jgi:hypothetical protein
MSWFMDGSGVGKLGGEFCQIRAAFALRRDARRAQSRRVAAAETLLP